MNTPNYSTEISSPVGRLQLRSNGEALTGLYFEKEGKFPKTNGTDNPDAGPFRELVKQLEEYFAGERREFQLPLAPEGTEFQRAVWNSLLTIGYGETMSYGALAKRIGRERAVRAVGLANGQNPISIIIPCHRVIGANGTLTGYGGGLERKQFLLDLERGDRLRLT